MISICIPVYNYDVRKLVHDLHQQATLAAIDFEILLVDDASDAEYQQINRSCNHLSHLTLTELERNTGRSKIRNILADMARYPWLIFMDCDSQCPDDQYISRYLKKINHAKVVCGGRIYGIKQNIPQTRLHWLFGKKREERTMQQRARKPNDSFMTNNFMISARIIREVRFNEDLAGYGHEDTLFGFDLLKRGIHIHHINNPLIHEGLQQASEFLAKNREATRNLIKVYHILQGDPALLSMVKLLRTWNKLRKFGLCRPVGYLLKLFEPFIVFNLKGKHPKIFLFDLFKLGNICRQFYELS